MQQYNDTEKEILQIQQALTDKTVSNRTLTDIHVEDVDAYIQQLQSEEPRNNKSRAVLRVIKLTHALKIYLLSHSEYFILLI